MSDFKASIEKTRAHNRQADLDLLASALSNIECNRNAIAARAERENEKCDKLQDKVFSLAARVEAGESNLKASIEEVYSSIKPINLT